MSYAVGSLVAARGREWVVQPGSEADLLVLRPLGGSDDELTGIYLPLEGDGVRPAHLAWPAAEALGDHRSCRLLRDAVRIGFRSSAGPFRSFARLACEPRPYQLVPLLMALKQDVVRLLIADDVGIGKTIEAALIARELLDRGEIRRLAVLSPPHLAEQWQQELATKFHLDAELVLPSTVRRLERRCRGGQSLFDVYDFVVVSTEFVKSDRRRDDFLRACPECVIVDEAHGCAFAAEARGGRHQRHQLVKGLARDPERHLILVTATPHSGNEDAFRSLLALLHPDLAELPADLSGPGNERHRRRLAAYFVQRRRGDVEHYLDADTPFPKRFERQATYELTPAYKKLFERALAYARETVTSSDGARLRQRVRWWSALALLRALASSPMAAAATLRNRAEAAGADSAEEADALGRRLLDQDEDEATEGLDVAPGSDPGEEDDEGARLRRRLREMAREAEGLAGAGDAKIARGAALVRQLLDDGFHPILFCRFIPTAEYVAEELRRRLGKDVEVMAVTGLLPPAEREKRVAELGRARKRVLVATDCLSEGINLQDHFDAVVHYDLAWNPTRHEQRAGRVDRYGQPRCEVRALTLYGVDNQIDGVVLDVLIRKHESIRSSLGISVPVPMDTAQVLEAVFEGLVLREQAGAKNLLLPFTEWEAQKDELHGEWQAAAEREKRSRTMFAQHAIRPEAVQPELDAARRAIGAGRTVERFTREALAAHGAILQGDAPLAVDLAECPRALREALGRRDGEERFRGRFELPVADGELYLHRTHPIVEGLARYVQDTALDAELAGVARRAGVIRTRAVERRTTLLLLRLRFQITGARGGGARDAALLAEDCALAAFAGSPGNAEWLEPEAAEALLDAAPDANLTPDVAAHHLRAVLDAAPDLEPALEEIARRRGDEILAAHRRVRTAARARGFSQGVEPKLPADVLGVYVYLPA
ncbi:MAG: ATP-dependent helicase [Acidobacteria bacterium]|nr:MAG: ATP-dependent helicase [Acidobacteriota bacterium]